ncbi:MAG: type IV pilus assembly protein PilM [Acidimicrobiia bacterium]
MAETVGLEIGTSAVRAVALDTGKSPPLLERFGEVALPTGALVGGEIMDEQVVTDALATLWKQAKLPRKRIVVGLANQRVIVRRLDLPYMEEGELVEALPFQVQEYIPIPIEDALLDFVPLEEFSTPEGEPMLSALVVAAQRDMVDGVLRVVGGAGLRVMAVDLQAFALARALVGEGLSTEDGSQGVVDIGGGVTQVVLVRDGAVRFARILTMGGEDFTNLLATEMQLGLDQAEQLKRRVGVAPEGTPTGEEGEALARRLLTRQADVFIEEIRGSVDYYLSQVGEDRPARLVVAGTAARLPNLANRLGKALGTTVEPARVLDDLKVGRTGLSEAELLQAQPVLPVPVGLALWEPR